MRYHSAFCANNTPKLIIEKMRNKGQKSKINRGNSAYIDEWKGSLADVR
jgi:hypothetical protein